MNKYRDCEELPNNYVINKQNQMTKLTLLQYYLTISIAFLVPTNFYIDIMSYFVYIATALFFV